MTAGFLAPAAGALFLSPGLLLARGRGSGTKRLRFLIHFLSLVGFAWAGWTLARGGARWAGLAVLGLGAAWIGFFWLVAIRRRLAAMSGSRHRQEREDVESEVGMNVLPRPEEALEPQNRALLKRLLAMGETRVGAIATPREEIVYADCAGGVAEVLRTMRASGHLRIPMADGSIDRIVGVVHAKDLAPLSLGGRPSPALRSLMRRPLFVSRDRTVAGLLEIFRSQRSHLAVVVDEYNRTLGVVTRDDLFHHLLGGGERTAG